MSADGGNRADIQIKEEPIESLAIKSEELEVDDELPNTTDPISDINIKTEQMEDVAEPNIAADENDLKNKNTGIILVKCGPLTGKMLIEQFVCPGIHQPCILVDGETELVTPKLFTIKAGKDKQKDWKGSIRIGKSNLRTLMEMHALDFYNHQFSCSAKCQSRNYLPNKDNCFPPQENDSQPAVLSDLLSGGKKVARKQSRSAEARRRASLPVPKTELTPPLANIHRSSEGDLSTNAKFAGIYPITAANNYDFLKNSVQQLQLQRFNQITQALRQGNAFFNSNSSKTPPSMISPNLLHAQIKPSTISSVQNLTQGPENIFEDPACLPSTSSTGNFNLMTRKPFEIEQMVVRMKNEPVVFWQEMTKFGLVDGVVDMMIETMRNYGNKLKAGNVSNVAPFLSKAIASLGVTEKLCDIITKKKFEHDLYAALKEQHSAPEKSRKRKSEERSKLFESSIAKMLRSASQDPISSIPIPANSNSVPSAVSVSLPGTSTTEPTSTSSQLDADFSSAILMQSVPNQTYSEMLMHLG